MTLNLESLNWLPILAAALVTFFLGGLWYTALFGTALFGKAWVRLHGYSEEKVAQMKAAKPPPVFFGVMLLSYLLLAAVMDITMATFGIEDVAGGITLGALLWLGPALCIGATSYISSDRHIGIYAIDLAYQLTFLVMMGAILGAWR